MAKYNVCKLWIATIPSAESHKDKTENALWDSALLGCHENF